MLHIIYVYCSLTDIPTVDSSEMGEAFLGLLEEADEYDLIHDVVIKVSHKHRLLYKKMFMEYRNIVFVFFF